eukprot:scaffold2678_cov356-Pavlova_lutheri.AAC.5
MRQRPSKPDRTFQVGQQVKVQFGLNSPTDKDKLDPYWAGPFTVAANLGNGAYRLHLPPRATYSNRFNAERLATWHDSNLSLFPAAVPATATTLPTPPEDVQYRLRKYLLRDYSQFPTIRYWVETDLSNADRYIFFDETSQLLEDILSFEEQNGALPEKGITTANKVQIQKHKETVYLQYPNPILQNTWPFRFLPYQTRTRPNYKAPSSTHQAVVQSRFIVDGSTFMPFQPRDQWLGAGRVLHLPRSHSPWRSVFFLLDVPLKASEPRAIDTPSASGVVEALKGPSLRQASEFVSPLLRGTKCIQPLFSSSKGREWNTLFKLHRVLIGPGPLLKGTSPSRTRQNRPGLKGCGVWNPFPLSLLEGRTGATQRWRCDGQATVA